jgi:hypothetical protein
MWLIWCAYALLGIAIALFGYTINVVRPDIGVVFGATILLGMAGTSVSVLLLGGSALGTYGMVRQPASRRVFPIISVLAGVMGGTFLGWIALNFWTN